MYQKAKVLSIAVPKKPAQWQHSAVGFRHVPAAIAHCRLAVLVSLGQVTYCHTWN